MRVLPAARLLAYAIVERARIQTTLLILDKSGKERNGTDDDGRRLLSARVVTFTNFGLLRRASDVPSDASAAGAPERHVRPWRRWDQARISLNSPGTGRTTQRLPRSIAGDELQCLRGIVGGRTRLSHSTSWDTSRSPLPRGTGARRVRLPQDEARASPAVASDEGDDLRLLPGLDL